MCVCAELSFSFFLILGILGMQRQVFPKEGEGSVSPVRVRVVRSRDHPSIPPLSGRRHGEMLQVHTTGMVRLARPSKAQRAQEEIHCSGPAGRQQADPAESLGKMGREKREETREETKKKKDEREKRREVNGTE